MLRLTAQQTANMQIARHAVPLSHYLKQPRRLVHALMNPDQVEELSDDTFRFHLRGFQFLMLNIRPVVDLQIDASHDHVLTVRSLDCWIKGNQFINEQFALNLQGQLQLTEQATVTDLTGDVDLAIAIGLPPILALTPHAILETTGNQILRGVLNTIKHRLMHQLASDYQRWSRQQAQQQAAPSLAFSASRVAASGVDH
ncbi:DUF1997 domain-containing protein [Halomicronema sp. CCY15110]|uniref:DUF1997 domain-containing protein n=1 Tax=Halomicronema sp. CCY15110 TaxID=2767773 RepID=UPI0019514B86|nr:DUF1997 domain-containing protein [Halomicronema sp. CCY15110]